MKLLVIGIDSMDPRLVFEHSELFPFMTQMGKEGVANDYGAYTYGYGSRDNWISMYTGLSPQEHGVINNLFHGERRPKIGDYEDKKPFWQVINKAGMKVGMINGLATSPTTKVDGYMMAKSRASQFREDVGEGEYLTPVFNESNKELQVYIQGQMTYPKKPRSVESYGCTWEEIYKDSTLLGRILEDDGYYQDGLDHLKNELDFLLVNMITLQEKEPVDLMYVYTPTLDLIQHFQLFDPKKRIVLEAMQLIDIFAAKLNEQLQPDNMIVISDHGMSSFAQVVKSDDIAIQKEAFGMRDTAVWVSSECIAIPAKNNAVMSACHDYLGVFLAKGKNIKHTNVKNMKTLDFYPTLLELMDVKVPSGRDGYVLDIITNKSYMNPEILLTEEKVQAEKEQIAIIQNLDVNQMNTVINEIALKYRFAEITLYCDKRYHTIFEENKRIKVLKDNTEKAVFAQYDHIYTGTYSAYTRKIDYLCLK